MPTLPCATVAPASAESLAAAGLVFSADAAAGIRRVRSGKAFRYLAPDGRLIRDAATLARIRSLAIPPAWENVWICCNASGHIQATGKDARGRKQYRYHPRWRQTRDETKYGKLLAFAHALPRIRKQVDRDLRRRGLPKEKVLAAVVRLLESTLARVGNDDYARTNQSYGLTTIHNRHVRINGARIRFEFRGKSGVEHEIDLTDRRLAELVRRCQELPGQELFEYVGADGASRDVTSADVNDYLRRACGQDFTAKDLRTWAGTVMAAEALNADAAAATPRACTRRINAAVAVVAARLRNTKAVCRQCYIHPAVVEAYRDGSLTEAFAAAATPATERRPGGLSEPEAAVLILLRRLLKRKVVAAGVSTSATADAAGRNGRGITPAAGGPR